MSKDNNKIAILFGAGASFGSEISDKPPLGSNLFDQIRHRNIGPKINYTKMNELYGDMADMIGIVPPEVLIHKVSIEEWVSEISLDALSAFSGPSGFEAGMRLLSESIANKNKWKTQHFMGQRNIYGDISLPDKIMWEVAGYLYQFKPSADNIYRQVLSAMPDQSIVATLNYDSLLEAIAVEQKINLYEVNEINKVVFTKPEKEFSYYQLHGGVTLVNTWNSRSGISGLIMQTDRVERVSARAFVLTDYADNVGVGYDLGADFYDDNVKTRVIMSYYNNDKTNWTSPPLITKIQDEFSRKLKTDVGKLIVIGCRYTPHDEHIWGVLNDFDGEVYWVGTKDEEIPFERTVFIEKYFKDAVPEILDLLQS